MIRLIEENREAIDRLCRKYHVAKLEVFGSAVFIQEAVAGKTLADYHADRLLRHALCA